MKEDNQEILSVIEKAKGLDSEAIAFLFNRYYPKIYRYIYYWVKTKEDAQDLASEVFIRLVKSIRYQSGNFDAWIYAIAKNLITDYYRRNATRKESCINEKMVNSVSCQDKDDPMLTEEELKQSMQSLTEEQSQIIALKFIEGYDNEKISQITGKSIGAIKALQFRAILALKEVLKREL